MPGAIQAEGLVKTFGDVKALDGVDLEVPEGTVLGLLGPNGAGKTTTVRCLTTLLRPDSGRAVVAGIDVLKDPDAVRRSIGLSGQFAAVDEYLTGRENLQMVGQLYQMKAKAARARADELLEQFHLADAADRTAKTYSGGMRRRLDLAAALVVSPPVMFMDEPTTGLDPRNRQQLWEVIKDLVSGGTTLLLTTQYLEEADHLAHDIAVVDHGKVIAQGTSDQLKARTGGERVEVVVHEREHIRTAAALLDKYSLRGLGQGDTTVEEHMRKITTPVSGGAKLLAEIIRELDTEGIEIDDIGLRRPTLDDVFLSSPAMPPSPSCPTRRPRSECRHRIRADRVPRERVHPLRPRLAGRRQAQPDPYDAHPRGGHLRADPADHVRGAVLVRVRRLAGRRRLHQPTGLPRVPDGRIFAQTVTFATAGAGAGIAEDMHKGLIDRFRSLPMARGAVLTGRTLADMVQTALTLLVLAIVALLVGWRTHTSVGEVLGAFGLLLLTGYAFTWIGAVIGLSVRTPRRPPPAAWSGCSRSRSCRTRSWTPAT